MRVLFEAVELKNSKSQGMCLIGRGMVTPLFAARIVTDRLQHTNDRQACLSTPRG